jgi:hypothetical protein
MWCELYLKSDEHKYLAHNITLFLLELHNTIYGLNAENGSMNGTVLPTRLRANNRVRFRLK